MNTDINTILESIKEHSQYRSECLNFIASENAMSPVARTVLSSDLANRYTVGNVNNIYENVSPSILPFLLQNEPNLLFRHLFGSPDSYRD
jgi:hypothetical protein